MSPDDVVVVEAVRSIIGSSHGGLKDLSAAQLGGAVADHLLARVEKSSQAFSRSAIDYFVCGMGIGAGVGQNLPRQIAQQSGLAEIATAFVVNEMCGSGMEAIILGSQALKLGESSFALVGGVEAPDGSPWLITRSQLIDFKDLRVADLPEKLFRADVYDSLWDKTCGVHTIVHAEKITAEWVARKGLDPEVFKRKIDEYAKLSHDRALAAAAAGDFQEEIVPVPGAGLQDELPAKKNLELMVRRRGTSYTPDGRFLSNHNSPPLADCASFLLLTRRRTAEQLGLKPLGRIVSHARAGTAPERYLLASLAAARELLQKTKTRIEDYDLVESNTAFGSQMLINQAELGLDMSKVNIHGDCIALGHPIGAAGARITTTLLHALKRTGKKRGLAMTCLGGGNGIALAVEREEKI